VKQQIIDWFRPIVIEYYGGSETGLVVWCDSAEWLAHPGTVGRPTDGADVRIVDADGVAVPVGEVGVVYVKPADYWPDFTYWGDDDKRRSMELDGYVTVGDMGRVDEDGFLYLTDRASDMVISGGVNIYPAEVETALSEMDGVRDSAVFGIPDPEYGESLAAHIEVDLGSTLTEDVVRDHIRARLAGYKVPKIVVFTEELPREESGKLFKRRLREEYWADQAISAMSSPSCTTWPSLTARFVTVPSDPAVTGISIFIDSRITTVSPPDTASPSPATTFQTFAIISARSSSDTVSP
jgi:long-chain acyl-CoA synthetase